MESERTNKVLEKWGVDENMNKDDLIKAAEMFAKIQIKNRFLKRTVFLGITIMVVFLGLMLGSVILGAEVSKEFKVKNEILVQNSKGETTLKTSETYYSVKLNLLTSLSTIEGLKSLKFVNKVDGSMVQFKVTSFYYIHGRNLTIYGERYMANVLGNGEIEFYSISNVNGVKKVEENKMIRSSEVADLSIISNNINSNENEITRIYDCDGLRGIQSTGKFALMNNINCELSEPLLPNGFYGIINGRGYTINLEMNRNGPVALFTKLGSSSVIGNLFISGNIVGKGNCSAFAIEAYVGSRFLSNAVYATIICGNINDELQDYTNLGGYAAVLRNPDNLDGVISFIYSVNNGFFNSVSTNTNKVSYTGGFYGRFGFGEQIKTSFNFTYSATNFTRYGNNSFVNRFGFKFAQITNTQSRSGVKNNLLEKRDPYIPDDCYNYDQTNQNFINMCIDWYLIYWFENYDCCSDFNSCPYIMCDLYSKDCLYCQHKKNGNQSEKIVPIVQKICGFDE